jgi:hypothetical protein
MSKASPAPKLKDIAAHGGYFCACCQKFCEIDPDKERWQCLNRGCGSYRVKRCDPVPGCADHFLPQFPHVAT